MKCELNPTMPHPIWCLSILSRCLPCGSVAHCRSSCVKLYIWKKLCTAMKFSYNKYKSLGLNYWCCFIYIKKFWKNGRCHVRCNVCVQSNNIKNRERWGKGNNIKAKSKTRLFCLKLLAFYKTYLFFFVYLANYLLLLLFLI